MKELYIGALTGTSMNSFDAAVFNFETKVPALVAHYSLPFPSSLRERLTHLSLNPHTLQEYVQTEQAVSQCFVRCIQALLEDEAVTPQDIVALGIHGQTVLHETETDRRATLQILDPNHVSAQCGLPVVSDFRRRNLVEGGEGAPLAPLVHRLLFQSNSENRAVVNIGGIANITQLPTDGALQGFDTGPGGALLDEWSQLHLGQDYDESGQWARGGTVQEALLTALLKDDYFIRMPPKSTSREYFNRDWLEGVIADYPTEPQDVQTTLTELTARSIAATVKDSEASQLLVAGGGARNTYLMERLRAALEIPVAATDDYGLDVEWVECCLFALLARMRLNQEKVDLREVTGGNAAVLGAIWSA